MSRANTESLVETKTAPFATREEGLRVVTQVVTARIASLSLEALNRVAMQLLEGAAIDVLSGFAGETRSRHVDTPHSVTELQGAGLGGLVNRTAARTALDAISHDDDSTDWAQSELLGAVATADRLNIARATLDNWRRAGKVVAFRRGVRNYVYPMRQFVRLGPAEGLGDVTRRFASPEDAWEWLVTPNRYTGDQPPLDRLKAGLDAEVTGAAEGALDFM
jgi:hypothetical protein